MKEMDDFKINDVVDDDDDERKIGRFSNNS